MAGEPRALYWLSFVDPRRPKGSRFLGVALAEGHGLADACDRARAAGVNPGGEVLGGPVAARGPLLDPRWRGRLLSRQDAEALDAEMAAYLHTAPPQTPVQELPVAMALVRTLMDAGMNARPRPPVPRAAEMAAAILAGASALRSGDAAEMQAALDLLATFAG